MAEKMLKRMKCCQVDALVSIDNRGQLVLPKEVRDRAGIKAGDKFVLISNESQGETCCLFLVKADYFSETIKGALGPMVKDILE
jgi:AbrB family looped-hinge helix DNA binding protein